MFDFLGTEMNKKIDISDVKIEWLNKRALVLISIFAHAANKSEGKVIDLRAGDVLGQVSNLAKTTDDSELIGLYQRIKREIKISLSEENATTEATQEVSKLAVYDGPADVENRYRPL